MKKFISVLLTIIIIFSICICCTGCNLDNTSYSTANDIKTQQKIADDLASSQSTPTDIDYSLERYNLIRRTYWVNGQREKANTLPCEVEKPFGYIVLFSGNTIVGNFIVDGKVSSLNSFLTPSCIDEYVCEGGVQTIELSDVDGSYGENDSGIFFFTPDGKYIEWTGTYIYSDIPFEVNNPVLNIEGGN